MEVKERLRKQMRQQRNAFPHAQQAGREMMRALVALKAYQTARTVMTYVSFGSEVCTRHLIQRLFQDGKQVCVPLTEPQTRQMHSAQIFSMDDLVPGNMGVLEPKQYKPIALTAYDLVVVPGLAFDEKGHRLGYGAGYYDRFLQDCPATKVGLCYQFGLVPSVFPEQHDVPVDLIVTEKSVVVPWNNK